MTTLTPIIPDIGAILSTVWRRRLEAIGCKITAIVCVILIYLASELIIWGLSFALVPAKVEFFASILSMAFVFIIMTGLDFFCHSCNAFYEQHIKPRVDFINSHLGIGFPIPLVMLDKNHILGGVEIARIICTFVLTNLISWTACFVISFCFVSLGIRARSYLFKTHISTNRPHPNNARFGILVHWDIEAAKTPEQKAREKSLELPDRSPPIQSTVFIAKSNKPKKSGWAFLSIVYPILLSLLIALLIGAPVAATTHDHRLLDGCILWCVWISSVRMQRCFKASQLWLKAPRVKNIVATVMNPVLITTLIMMGYTRLRVIAAKNMDLPLVLEQFSLGSPLHAIWTSSVTKTYPPNNPSRYFGAGDAALSILECGIVIWGFKLHECRRQLFSQAGLLAILISVLAAAANVFFCTFLGHRLGLETPEALAFAARSTTLALAKPAMEAIGGNLAVNAALVVTNGIIGQLMYPYLLGRLNVKQDSYVMTDGDVFESRPRGCTPESSSSRTSASEGSTTQMPTSEYSTASSLRVAPSECSTLAEEEKDDPMTIAAGIAIGINGAAMGVAYLHETKSRAAPYSALAMTVFGLLTVVFTTVEPFKTTLIALASF